MNVKLLQELVEAHGAPSQEDAIREIVRRELKDLCEIHSDAMGNMICVKKATKSSGTPKKLMLAAHMDEIGFIVRHIDNDGFIRLQAHGGFDPRQMASQRVLVHTRKNGALEGVLVFSTKPSHTMTDEERRRGPDIDSYFVDLGLSGDEAKEKVGLGDMVTMNRGFQKTGGLFTCKAMDDRVCVFIMIEAMKALKDHSVDVYAVGTVQEEVGVRGASAAGWSVAPDICVALDITLAGDIPGMPEEHHCTKLGKGTAIKLRDSMTLCSPKLVEHFRQVAEKNEIAYQIEVLPAGGTDSGGIQRLHGGIPAITISTPCRYIHTVNETVHPNDVQACIDLMTRYMEDAHNGDYMYR